MAPLETLTPHYSAPPSTHEIDNMVLEQVEARTAHVHLVGDFSDPEMSQEAAMSNINERWNKQCEAILALPTKEEGLDMDRVNGFCDRLGLAQKPVCVLSPDDYDKALTIAEMPSGTEDGKYLPRLDIVIVRRNPDKEALNGTGYTESIIAHERAHATTKDVSVEVEARPAPAIIRSRMPMILIPSDKQTGFMVSAETGGRLGAFIEEGVPELVRGMYITDVLKKPAGFVSGRLPGEFSFVDPKYLFYDRTPSGEVVLDCPEGAIAAMTLDLLAQRHQELWQALWSARDSIDGLTKIATYLNNSVQPGIFDKMFAIDVETLEGQKQAADLYASLAV